ncbi:fascin domain-containing protein [Trinickia dinghuensis]|uniref:Ricin B lectin domain-containing protein n=1 Tax=Trinickia dinghuensis TaxID=2291023 RepID=A0A3D8K3F3_9BURK|nr:hypothetical protein [Trinickia dinghuensis]RDU99997.1 hypothetical protein DWV00_06335 [Trinickia dinghuensis]
MDFETIYLMTENGRFVCTDQFGDLTIKNDRADASCRQRAGWGAGESTVVLYNPAADRFWAVAPDPATPHVDGLVTAQKNEWTTFNYEFADADRTSMTLRTVNGDYVSRIDIGRPQAYLAASATNAGEASRFRVIRFADDAA